MDYKYMVVVTAGPIPHVYEYCTTLEEALAVKMDAERIFPSNYNFKVRYVYETNLEGLFQALYE